MRKLTVDLQIEVVDEQDDDHHLSQHIAAAVARLSMDCRFRDGQYASGERFCVTIRGDDGNSLDVMVRASYMNLYTMSGEQNITRLEEDE